MRLAGNPVPLATEALRVVFGSADVWIKLDKFLLKQCLGDFRNCRHGGYKPFSLQSHAEVRMFLQRWLQQDRTMGSIEICTKEI